MNLRKRSGVSGWEREREISFPPHVPHIPHQAWRGDGFHSAEERRSVIMKVTVITRRFYDPQQRHFKDPRVTACDGETSPWGGKTAEMGWWWCLTGSQKAFRGNLWATWRRLFTLQPQTGRGKVFNIRQGSTHHSLQTSEINLKDMGGRFNLWRKEKVKKTKCKRKMNEKKEKARKRWKKQWKRSDEGKK